ncbi:hypothetical protein [Cellulomonas chengniuliangii]|uniref:hypothetical protein n=1 Tax=Cellulomonas chengniuliangii TaxID=2968084 RepID=UPI001D0E52DE|nr:hypothetical protein [Cellulomonas chengniuliangii]MCC2317098.1 hypothetical protein [Cellulomonas chengniuliangii]
MRRARVHVTGASGSGTTTLARTLADVWAVPHADTDDYFWLPTDPPFVQSRPPGERVALMRQVFLPRAAWVLSGSILDWGDEVIDRFDAVVFLTLDPAERIRRLEPANWHARTEARWARRPMRRSWPGPGATTTLPSRAAAGWRTRSGWRPCLAPSSGSTAR